MFKTHTKSNCLSTTGIIQKRPKVVICTFLNHGLGLVAVCVMIVIALVLFPEQMLPALRVTAPGAHCTRRDGEDDGHEDERCYHGDGDDLGQSDRTSWKENCERVIIHDRRQTGLDKQTKALMLSLQQCVPGQVAS